jgi:hypothetical protein
MMIVHSYVRQYIYDIELYNYLINFCKAEPYLKCVLYI